MSRRVVVTGLGAVTPIGNNVDDFWAAVKAGKIGFDHITKFDTTDYKCHIAAELKDFNPQDFMDRKAAKRMEPFSQYAVAAAKQAIDDSGLDIEKEDPYMVGCAIGSGVGSLQAMEAIKYLIGVGELLTGYLLTYDALTMEFHKIKLPKDTHNCAVCGDHPTILEPIDYEQEVCEETAGRFDAPRTQE